MLKRLPVATAAALLVAAACPAATALPAADGNQPTARSSKTSVPLSCRAQSPVTIGSRNFTIPAINATMITPETITVGQPAVIGILIHPLVVSMPSLPGGAGFRDASRIAVDFRLPDGLDVVDAAIDNEPGQVTGFAAFTVDEQGRANPAGRILRLAGNDNATIGFSPNAADNSAAGATVEAESDGMRIVLPTVVATVTARRPGSYPIALNTRGPAGQFNNRHNFLGMLVHVHAPVIGDIWVPVTCSPRPSPDAPIAPASQAILTVTAVAPDRDGTTGDTSPSATATATDIPDDGVFPQHPTDGAFPQHPTDGDGDTTAPATHPAAPATHPAAPAGDTAPAGAATTVNDEKYGADDDASAPQTGSTTGGDATTVRGMASTRLRAAAGILAVLAAAAAGLWLARRRRG
ncbi:hypothetical protein ACFSSC_02270 [Corynebacterium mendelii]|uniref:SDR-like Ig domain-containing protein n=1 Tax=Corynebacterium mendelii TaxID=2765362 RepID=A0A939IXI9_9CORY|nr:hypothetical protein [Corynebacterium mendelii]MBN9644108.1 hypothetical protein [Corynebacterium mendelii]